MENDQELKRFFTEMKKQDEVVLIPDFPETKVNAVNWWMPIGIAASLLLGGFIWMNQSPEPELHKDMIIISLEKGENDMQEIKIEEKAYIDTWESGSSSLLTEF